MPGTRILVIADAKLLPALAGGLREAGKFDVTPIALADREAAQAAVQNAEALALFYGAAGAPLPAAIQALAPQLRQRAGRVVAVLQKNQAAMRDDCFRAGASDVLFMPMPKDQFMARLAAAIDLAFAAEPGARAPVSVATRAASSKLEQASISAAGVDALTELPLRPGETVRISWDSFQQWGLVVRGSPTARIRFAGTAPEEEAKIRAWVEGAGRLAAPPPEVSAPAPAAPASAARAAPTAGPPPGFADRKPVRATTRPQPGPGNGAAAPEASAPPAAAAGPAPSAPRPATAPPPASPQATAPPSRAPAPARTPAPARPPAPSGAAPPASSEGATARALFDEEAAVPRAEAPEGPAWPTPVEASLYKTTLMQLLRDQGVPEGLTPAIVASAKKITGIMSASEREALVEAGADSPIADALSARIALDSSTVEGAKLAVRVRLAAVDAAAVAGLTKAADDSAARLQKSANAAIGKGEVEELQLITSVSASLSRDLLNFKEMADRLRGVASGPRMGVGSLDPDVVLPGQNARPRPLAAAQPQQQKAELRDFRGLDARPTRFKPFVMVVVVLGAVAAAVNGFYFALPRHSDVPVRAAGEGVARIDVAGDAALITVTPDWIAHADARMPQLLGTLRAHEVKKAALTLPSGATVGLLDVSSGKVSGGTFSQSPAEAPAAPPSPEPASPQAQPPASPQAPAQASPQAPAPAPPQTAPTDSPQAEAPRPGPSAATPPAPEARPRK